MFITVFMATADPLRHGSWGLGLCASTWQCLAWVLGYKIPVIENLGATLDQFDAIDFSDNEIRKLDGFPR
ncbi:hypothetical protein QTO34_012809 [Cnephaeus nilssonii]|uniref:Uncharacterized protein n=1 Tax=Cnephaeus nilssonii TaxID=3371016 RepID=A0AA40LCS0_CNENI|nr:hypothetical protein QTO34_012809 [Eptesicus nilssonii]